MVITIRIFRVFPFSRSKDEIIPTPAGKKKKARLSRRYELRVLIDSVLTIFSSKKVRRINIPKILPGIGKESPLLILSLKKVINKIIVSSLKIFI